MPGSVFSNSTPPPPPTQPTNTFSHADRFFQPCRLSPLSAPKTNPNWKQQRARQLQRQVLGRGKVTAAADRKLTLSVSFTERVR